VGTLIGDKFIPGLLDRYLARTGFAAQQTDTERPDDDPDNLNQPADGRHRRDFGTHGRFDRTAKTRSYQLWASQHHGAIAATAAGIGAFGWERARRRQQRR
jgi:hypothetical protein